MPAVDKLIARLKDTMEKRGVNQTELAKLTGIRTSSISDYLTGKYVPKQDKIDLMAQALSVNAAWLMGYDFSNEKGELEELNKKDEEKIEDKLKDILDDLSPDTGIAFYNNDEPISDDDKELIRDALKGVLRLTATLAKRRDEAKDKD